jgi:hypothetical protein
LNRFLIRENMVTHLANCEVVIIINHPKFGEETKRLMCDLPIL